MDKTSQRSVLCTMMFTALLLVLSTASVSRADEPRAQLGLGRVTYITGDTVFNSPNTDEWDALTTNFTLRDGDRLWAGDGSKIEARFVGGGGAWVNYKSELDMVKLAHDDNGDTLHLALVSGEASFKVKNFNVAGSVFQVDTPDASIRAYGNALFRATVLSDGNTQVGILRGAVEVETPKGVTQLKKGDMFEVDKDGNTVLTSLPQKDGWDDWVLSRSSRYERPGKSARYLPEDLRDYSYEFDEGGRWVEDPTYGRVWRPIDVAPDWSPYSNGRWVWIDYDYVWLPYDPWYAPFHYGRWAWTAPFGWFWVPPLPGVTFWSPGFVGWCSGPSDVFWVPLAPFEIYYGFGFFGPYSVNVFNTRVINVTNVYINSRHRHGFVGVDRDRFLHGDYGHGRHAWKGDNPFTHRGAVGTRLIGRAPVDELKPIRETRVPRPNVRPEGKALPPERLKGPHPFVKERGVARGPGRSAFRPEGTPQRIERGGRTKGQVERPGERTIGGRTRPAPPESRRVERQRERAGRVEDVGPRARGNRETAPAPGRARGPAGGVERGGRPAPPERGQRLQPREGGGRTAPPERGAAPGRGERGPAMQREAPRAPAPERRIGVEPRQGTVGGAGRPGGGRGGGERRGPQEDRRGR